MLIELITKGAEKEQDKPRPYRPSPYKVGRCVRSLVYDAQGIPPNPLPGRALLVFEDGTIHEDLIKGHIRKTPFELVEWKGVKQRFRIADINGYEMKGEVDGLIIDPKKRVRVLEIKSINHFSFERLDKEPEEAHRRQANLYLHGLREAGYDEINEALIIYKNKNNSCMKEFIVRYDRDLALADIQLFKDVEQWAKSNTIPARPYSYDSWQCEYCRWNQHCYKDYEHEFEALTEDVELSSDLEDAARFYNELGGQMNDMQKQREEAKSVLKEGLEKVKAKSGRVGDYVIERKMYVKQKYDKTLIPSEAIREELEERFYCRSITGGKK